MERIKKKELSLPGKEGLTRGKWVIFDGSTRQDEGITIIVRFVDDGWEMTQRLIRIDIRSKSVNADELAGVLNEALCVEFGIRLPSSSYEGWGKCKSSGAEQNKIRLSEYVERCLFVSHAR